jgi:citrate lyase subunit beta/citryl-CoA lyase
MSYNGPMATPMHLRTALFTPADDPRKCARAWTAGADAVVLDLEDAVAPAAKAEARSRLPEVLAARHRGCLAVVRINAPDSPEGVRDLDAVAGLAVDAVMVPKAEPATLAAAAGRGLPLIALVETAAGILGAEAVAHADDVALLMFGPVDLSAEIGCEPSGTGDELLVARSRLVLVSAAAGLPAPLDGPCLRVDDLEAVRAEAAYARRLGFGGKACIHPRQVAETRRIFSPSPEALAWAARVTAAFEAARERGSGVAAVDGRMIDAPVARRAYATLAKADR